MSEQSPFPVGKEIKKEFTGHISVNMSRKMADAITVAAQRHGMTHGAFLRLMVIWALDTAPGPVTDAQERWIDDVRGKKHHQAQFHVSEHTKFMLGKLAEYHGVSLAQLVRTIIARYLSHVPVTKPLPRTDHRGGTRPDTNTGRTESRL